MGDACAMSCGLSLLAGLWYYRGTGQSRVGPGAWPVAFDGEPYQTLLCSSVQFSSPTSWTAFGQVNASVHCKSGNISEMVPDAVIAVKLHCFRLPSVTFNITHLLRAF